MEPQRVLVVDDEEAVRETVSRYLSRGGHEVETAPDGAAALEAFDRRAFDVVVTDLNMPRLGGVDLVRRVKEKDPRTITIVLTGYGTLDSAVEVLHQGCDDYLLKPLPAMEVVSTAIERCLVRRRTLALAASHRKISQAKDNILEVVISEFSVRVKDADACAEALGGACTGDEAGREVKRLRKLLAELDVVIEQARIVGQTIRDRAGPNAQAASIGGG
jgi:DNA-binding NtrC family response regulator